MKSRLIVLAAALLALALCLTGCMSSEPLKLGGWQDFREEMLDKYDCIRRLEGKQTYPWLEIDVYYAGDTLSETAREDILDDLHTFLSGERFLAEYVPYGLANVDEAEVYVDPPMPDINIEFMRCGSDTREYQSRASYYTETFRSDRKMTVDNYQTWRDWDRAAQGETE